MNGEDEMNQGELYYSKRRTLMIDCISDDCTNNDCIGLAGVYVFYVFGLAYGLVWFGLVGSGLVCITM